MAAAVEALVLDAAPLLTQADIPRVAHKCFIPPTVLAELRDVRAREFLERLRMTGQIDLEVREPGAEAMHRVVHFSKLTGDYAVLSQPDLHVLALTYALETERHGTWRIRDEPGGKTGQQRHDAAVSAAKKEARAKGWVEPGTSSARSRRSMRREAEKSTQEPADASARPAPAAEASTRPEPAADASVQPPEPAAEASTRPAPTAEASTRPAPPAEASTRPAPAAGASSPALSEDDEETGGEWITPANIAKHKNRSLGLVSDESVADAQKKKRMTVACMTGDFAVQNVLLQMGLNLVASDGTRIERVKSWVLRCHACFRICKYNERKFCPSCGNPTLLRASVSTDAKGDSMKVHLKANYQYRNRGTKYSLPLPRAGSASGGRPSGSSKNAKTGVPILREDQPEWERGVAREQGRRAKEERQLQRSLARGQDPLSARYADPDWLPDLLTGAHAAPIGLPRLGVGRKNPNESRRRRR